MVKPSFGIFDHIEDIPGTSTPQLLKDRLDLIRMADEAGFAGFHLAEHHGTDLCMAPNQEVFIAAASQITKNIRPGRRRSCSPCITRCGSSRTWSWSTT